MSSEPALRVEGLGKGVDDYLVKPFALQELIARINVLKRRYPNLIIRLIPVRVQGAGAAILMGGQQIASVGKTIQVQAGYLQFPAAAANAVILLLTVLMMIWALMRLVDLLLSFPTILMALMILAWL